MKGGGLSEGVGHVKTVFSCATNRPSSLPSLNLYKFGRFLLSLLDLETSSLGEIKLSVFAEGISRYRGLFVALSNCEKPGG